MSLFQCEKCGVIENTALCHYWMRMCSPKQEPIALCSECDPGIGKWHDAFPKQYYPIGTMETDGFGNVQPKGRPCSHPGCQSHITHPCEKCGRQWGDR